jgi:hypothetical protein
MCPQLHGTRLLYGPLAAKSDCLLDEDPRMVNTRSRGASFLQLKILDGSAQSPELRERLFRDDLGNQVCLRALPETHTEVKRRGAGEAPLGGRKQRIDAPVQICVLRRE